MTEPRYLWGLSYKVEIVRSARIKRIALCGPEIMERKLHLEGLSFKLIEVARVFISVKSC